MEKEFVISKDNFGLSEDEIDMTEPKKPISSMKILEPSSKWKKRKKI